MEAVILIGIQAVGKTTFYTQRFSSTHVHINLDTLKTRPREYALLQACIAERKPLVVDNTNILRRERARYIEAARPAGYRILGYYFQSSLKQALERNRQLEIPSYSEGFDQLYYVLIDPLTSEFIVKVWDR